LNDLDHPPVADLEFSAHGARRGHKARLRLWLRLLSTTKLVSQEIRRRLRVEFDATLPQFDLLAQLYREPEGLRLGELSRRTMVTNGNVTGLADRLEADGLIRRETLEADRRVTVARLTRKGRDLFTTMAKSHESWIRELTAELDDNEIDVSLARLALIKNSVRSALTD
jgi:DNA-binding MarR family transcriptional regulator